MHNLYNDHDAHALCQHYAKQGYTEDLALRVYTSRLLGENPALVLHGGGNTSVKMTEQNLLGDEIEIICVKGSGWDLATIEPAGLPAMKLDPLRRLRGLKTLTDEAMVNFQRGQLIDSSSPNPSIETLLHAFLPHRFIDHTHANAILSLTNQPNGKAIIQELFGGQFGIVPYIKPGFDLAVLAADTYEKNPAMIGLILLHHGIFTFGDSAKTAYTHMIDAISKAEHYIQTHVRNTHHTTPATHPTITADTILPMIRQACTLHTATTRPERFIICHRRNQKILRYVNGKNLQNYSQRGVVTPDHIIRTKNKPLILPAPVQTSTDYQAIITDAIDRYKADYQTYFAKHANHQIMLDPIPRVILIPNIGLIALGKTAKEAHINADIAENTMSTILDAEQIGTYTALPESELFEMEYWSLEQAKLKKLREKPFTRQVVVVTGAAGTIGAATAKAFAHLGAEVALLDINTDTMKELAKKIGPQALPITCDLTNSQDVARAFKEICLSFGGVDVVVFNAGRAYTGKIGSVHESTLRASFELNFFAHQYVAQAATEIMLTQQTGGSLLFNVSKQALNPGPEFGPYGLAKSATLALVRQYALEYASAGIRANAVNADRVKSGLLTDEMIQTRANARGVSVEEYMRGNLLKREVTAEDVAQAFVHQALAQKTTAGITTVDGGNMAAAVR